MSRAETVLVPLLEGFEEIEAVTLIDVLRRAEIPVQVAGERAGPVRGAHDLVLEAETALRDVDPSRLAMVALPGGARAAAGLAAHETVQQILGRVAAGGGFTCALCAAPMALAAADLHRGRTVTSHPAFESAVAGAGAYSEARVVIDGPVVTSRAAGTAMEFALTLVGLLRGPELERQLTESMLVARSEPSLRVEGEA